MLPNMQTPSLEVPSTTQFAEEIILSAARTARLPARNLIAIVGAYLKENPDPSAQWELAALEGDAVKPAIENRSGPSLSTVEAAEMLKRTTQTIRNMVERNELIAYPEIHGRGWRFPRWEFTHGTVHEWVAPILEAYGYNGWGLLDFLTVPRIVDGESFTYLERLKSLRPEAITDVREAARRSNPD